MKTRKIIGAVVVVLVIAAGLWWYTQSAPTPVIVTTAPLTTKIAIAPESQSPIDRGRVEAQSSPELENSQSSAVTGDTSDVSIMLTRDQAWEQFRDATESRQINGAFLTNIFHQIDFADIPYLIENLSNLAPSSDRDHAVNILFGLLTQQDPYVALASVGVITDDAKRSDKTNRILGIMTFKDPDTAMAELAKMPPGQSRLTAYESVFQTWAAGNEEFGPAANAAALALPAGDEQTQALRGVDAGVKSLQNQSSGTSDNTFGKL